MKLILLGTGGYFPNDRRHTTCVMLPEIGLVFDAGTSFYRVPERLQTDTLQIVMTHAHLDHIFGLTFLLPALFTGRVKEARVYGEPAKLEAIQTHLFAEAVFPVLPDYKFLPIPDVLETGGGGRITHTRLTHPGGSLGYRVDWEDRSFAFITDTWCDGRYLEFIRGVDVLIHECYFPDAQRDFARTTGHSHTSGVAAIARDAGVGRLFLTHIDPTNTDDDPIGLETARAIFPQTQLAEDLLEIEF